MEWGTKNKMKPLLSWSLHSGGGNRRKLINEIISGNDSALKKIKAGKCNGEENAGNLNRGVKDILSKMLTFELGLD